MNKKIYYFFTIYIIFSAVIFFLFCVTSIFSLQITEINYDLEGSDSVSPGEWIEIYNDSTSEIEIGNIKFFESGAYHNIFNEKNYGFSVHLFHRIIVIQRPVHTR